MIKESKFINYYYEPNKKQIIKSYFTMDDKIIFNIKENQMVIKNYKNEKIDLYYDVKTKKFTYYGNSLNELPTEVLENIYEPYHKDIMKNKVLEIPKPSVSFRQKIWVSRVMDCDRNHGGRTMGDLILTGFIDEEMDIYDWIIVDYKEPSEFDNALFHNGSNIMMTSPFYEVGWKFKCVATLKTNGTTCNNSCKDCARSFSLNKIGLPNIYYRQYCGSYGSPTSNIKLMFCGCHKRGKARETHKEYEIRKTNEYLEIIGYKIKYGETGYILRK